MTIHDSPAPIAQPLDGIPDALLDDMLEKMLLARAFDSMLPTLYDRGLIQGSTHAAIGQEAVAVGTCAALNPDDYITSTHRGHGHAIAKGADITGMAAELLGKATGHCRGKGGSMHIADFSTGMLGANGIVGAGFGLATGAALASQLQGNGKVTVCFTGDGALNQGNFLECANMAAIWKLPVVFVCENNHYAMSAVPEKMTAVKDLTDRARGCGVEGVNVDGMDVVAVYRAVGDAVQHARDGHGPRFIAAECYRFEGHFSGDSMAYRQAGESAAWSLKDPIELMRKRRAESGKLSASRYEEMVASARTLVADALRDAEAAPFPVPAEAWEDLYA